jgi:hypothetical protein
MSTRSSHQGKLPELEAEVARLSSENRRLLAENKRLRGDAAPGPATQMRRCVNCKRDLPDGLSFYPGYLDELSSSSAAEAKRHHCVYCR